MNVVPTKNYPAVAELLDIPETRLHREELIIRGIFDAYGWLRGVWVGFSGQAIHQEAPYLYIEQVTVVESERGKGLGRALMNDAHSIARFLGCTRIILDSEADDFYLKLGYERGRYTGMVYTVKK